MSPFITWHIYQIIKDYLSPIVIVCVFNQFREHWLFSDALHFTIFLSFKFRKNNEFLPSFQSLMEDEFGLVNELTLLASNIRKEVCGVLNFFLSFLRKI
jgi:hypothetical protein